MLPRGSGLETTPVDYPAALPPQPYLPQPYLPQPYLPQPYLPQPFSGSNRRASGAPKHAISDSSDSLGLSGAFDHDRPDDWRPSCWLHPRGADGSQRPLAMAPLVMKRRIRAMASSMVSSDAA
jgi:hypothetical protein